MKLRFQEDTIVNGINIVMKAAPSETTMSIPECVLINASTNGVRLTGDNMELGIEIGVEGDILEYDEIALNVKLFSETTRGLSSENASVTVESDDKPNITIHCGNSAFNIQGRDGEELAYLPYTEKDKYICLSQFTLKEVVQQTIFSIAPNGSDGMIVGELFEVNENQPEVVSLDGHRISTRRVRLKDHYEDTKVIIPGKTLSEVSKISDGDNEKEVLIYFGTNHILFGFDNTVVVSRLIKGGYFRVSQMLPSDYKTKVPMNKKGFLDCIERATIPICENNKKPLIINIGDNSMELKLNSGLDSMNAELMVHKTGRDIMIRFNSKFLIDTLHVVDGEETNIYIMNPKSPCFVEDREGSYVHLILPVSPNVATV